MKLPGPRAFWLVIMAAVVVVTAPFFAAIIIATRQVVGVSRPGDVALLTLVDDSGGVIGVYDGSDGSLRWLDGSMCACATFMPAEWAARDLLPCFHMLMSRSQGNYFHICLTPYVRVHMQVP